MFNVEMFFIINFVNAMNLVEVFFSLFLIQFLFYDLVFNNFTKLLLHSHDALPFF